MTTHARPITEDQRETARRFIDENAARIRQAMGYVILRRYESPQPQYGIHEITGMQIGRLGGKIMRVHLKSTTVGLYSALIADEWAARVRFEQPLTSTLAWKHMPPLMRELVLTASILPTEWKYQEVVDSDHLDDRVRLTMATPVMQFLSA